MDITASTSKDYTIEEFTKLDKDKTNEEQTDNYEVQKKFVLPPEYDANDSRWTLKYREPAPGLVELMEHHGVYVNADKLDECEIWASDGKTFARMLLTEIFTTNALSTCSWTNESTDASDNHGGQTRPILNEHAKDTLLKYVVKYGQIRDWDRTDFQCIFKGIRQTILEMRRVRQKEEEQEAESDKLRELLKEKGFQKRQIVLPPEYDRYNSRWTLKYREYVQGLVELIEDSCVYVELSLLAKCKGSSNGCVTLARMLLNGIFTKSALSTCSWNGTTSKDSDHNDTNGRPGLDKNGMMTLMKFVSKYELENDWPVTDKNIIEMIIRQKLELLRRVARKGEEAGEADERRNKILRRGIDPPPEYRRVDCEADKNEEQTDNDKVQKKFVLPPEYDKNDSRWTQPAPGLVERIEHSDMYVNADNLPPEYDKNDSRWTLKYREPAPGLVELIEHSGVYVNADKLAEYKKKSNDCQTLAQMILTEVFSTKALRICTLSKKNDEFYNILCPGDTFAFNPLTLQLRPELDAYAEIILLNFVDEYALEKGWRVSNLQFIRENMMYKITEVRETYIIKARERRQAALLDRGENPAPPVRVAEESVTNPVGPRNPIWTAFYMKEYNLPK